jgi:diguanylate cyclase (GGDEF)-like protein
LSKQALIRLFAFLFFFSTFSYGQNAGQGVLLTYCVDPNWMPYEGLRGGKHIGISKDYINLIGQRTGITFSLLTTSSWSESVEFAKSGVCDVLPMLNASADRREYLSFSLPYFEAPNVLVTRRSDDVIPGFSAIGERTLGVVNGYRHVEYLSRYYRNIDLKFTNSEREGLLLLADGNIDVMLASLLSANAIINELNLDDLTISGYGELHDTLSLAVIKKHEGLLPAINQAIVDIPENRKVEVYKRWYQVKARSPKAPGWMLPVTVVTVLLLSIIFWTRFNQVRITKELHKRDRELETLQTALIERNRTVEFLSTHDDLTELNNRNFMLQKVEEEISRFQRFRSPATLLLIYAGGLQRKATHQGQDVADKIMKRLAEITLNRTREVDISARWSSDEILILCPQTSPLSAQILAERILTEIELQSLQIFEGLKVSIGVASLGEDESFSEWFDRTNNSVKSAQKQISHGYVISSN